MSGTFPPDVVMTLLVSGAANRPQRFWAYESVRFTAECRAGPGGPLIDVDGVSFAFLCPDGATVIAPLGFYVRLAPGTYACAIVPALAGTWNVVARCTSPSAAVGVRAFEVASLPIGTLPPPPTLVTDDSGVFLLLSDDGALITA